ncbi:MAG: phosphate ABC transporter permease PstA [Prochloron sp. SP5CPC1]|nr:phosphate ABC transporter permease PstA [Candidatus Paraprochloron terpiosi SP5CPC1]
MTSLIKDSSKQELFRTNLSKRYIIERILAILAWGAISIAILVLAVLLIDILIDGLPSLNLDFLNNLPSYKAERAGIKVPLLGTIWVMSLVAAVAFPLGVGAGIFLEEFAEDNWFTNLIEININNLAGVPSIIYGLLGLAVFVRVLEPITGGRSIISGALTLALLILPIIIVSTREALRAVPDNLRLAGLALGATKWQVIWEQILPLALPGILTGTILALSRAIGETAPLIVVGALAYITSLPTNLQSSFTVMPIQIFNWINRPQEEFHHIAAGGIIVLMVVMLVMNSTAVWLRNKFQNKV